MVDKEGAKGFLAGFAIFGIGLESDFGFETGAAESALGCIGGDTAETALGWTGGGTDFGAGCMMASSSAAGTWLRTKSNEVSTASHSSSSIGCDSCITVSSTAASSIVTSAGSGSTIGSDKGSSIGSRGGSGGKENRSSAGGRVVDLLLRSKSG